jgi:hypothetical protein
LMDAELEAVTTPMKPPTAVDRPDLGGGGGGQAQAGQQGGLGLQEP